MFQILVVEDDKELRDLSVRFLQIMDIRLSLRMMDFPPLTF